MLVSRWRNVRNLSERELPRNIEKIPLILAGELALEKAFREDVSPLRRLVVGQETLGPLSFSETERLVRLAETLGWQVEAGCEELAYRFTSGYPYTLSYYLFHALDKYGGITCLALQSIHNDSSAQQHLGKVLKQIPLTYPSSWRQPVVKSDSSVDVLIITAIKDELDGILQAESDWQPQEDSRGFAYHTRKAIGLAGREFSIAAARPIDMGGYFATNIATRLVNELNPSCLAMTGICAGWRGKVFLGDVIIADRVFYYDTGKLKAFRERTTRIEEVFHDIRTYNLNSLWVQKAQNFSSDWVAKVRTPRPLTYRYQELWLLHTLDAFEAGKGEDPRELADRRVHCPDWTEVLKRLEKRGLIKVAQNIKLTEAGKAYVAEDKVRYPEGIHADPDRPKVYVAPIGTGSTVVEDPDLFPTIARYERKVLAVDMEAAAIGEVAMIEGIDSFIIAKAVTDYGDSDKDDHFRSFAIETSYRFLMAFLEENLKSGTSLSIGA